MDFENRCKMTSFDAVTTPLHTFDVYPDELLAWSTEIQSLILDTESKLYALGSLDGIEFCKGYRTFTVMNAV